MDSQAPARLHVYEETLGSLFQQIWVYHAILQDSSSPTAKNSLAYDGQLERALDFAVGFEVTINKPEERQTYIEQTYASIRDLLAQIQAVSREINPLLACQLETRFQESEHNESEMLIGDNEVVQELKLLLHSFKRFAFDPVRQWRMQVLGCKGYPTDILSRILRAFKRNPAFQQCAWNQIDQQDVLIDRSSSGKLGHGGYSSVYKATWHGRIVAAKLYNEKVGIEPFLREMATWAPLEAQNIVALLGGCIGQNGSSYFAIMPAYPHRSIQYYLDVKSNSAAELLSLSHDVGLGLYHLHHTYNVCHGDLKSSNVLVDANGKALLIDFGLAVCLTGDDWMRPRSSTTKLRGSIRWMSPQRTQSGEITKADDVYGLGMTLWEIWTLRKPFDMVSDRAIENLVKSGKRMERPHEPEIDDEIWNLLNRCWDAPQVPFTAAEAHETLQNLKNDESLGIKSIKTNEWHNGMMKWQQEVPTINLYTG